MQNGSSFIEILITLLILSIAVLGLMQLQHTALQILQESYSGHA